MRQLNQLIKERNESKTSVMSEIILQFKEQVDKYGYSYFDELFRGDQDDYLNRNDVSSCSFNNKASSVFYDLYTNAHGSSQHDVIARAVELYFVTPEQYHQKKIDGAIRTIRHSINNIRNAIYILNKQPDYEQIANHIKRIIDSIPKDFHSEITI